MAPFVGEEARDLHRRVALAAALVLSSRFAHPYWTALLFLILQPVPIYVTGLVAWSKAPEHPTARRLMVGASLYALSLGCESVLGAVRVSRGAFGDLWPLDLAATSLDVVGLVVIARMLALFPDGRYERRYERRALGALWALSLAPLLIVLAGPTLAFPRNVFVSAPTVASPVAVAWLRPLGDVATAVYEARIQLLLVGLVLLLLRFRRAGSQRRLQIKWVLYTVALMGTVQVLAGLLRVSGLVTGAALDAASPYLNAPILTFTLIAAAVAIFGQRALDIDLVIRKSLLFGGLWLVIGIGYVGVAAGLGIIASQRLPVGAAILVTVAVTLGCQPVRHRFERVAGRLVFGERLSGYDVLTRFGQTIEHAFDADELAPQIAVAVRGGLGLAWARVSLDLTGDGGILEPAGAAGIGLDEPVAPAVVVPLAHGGQRLGVIECGPKLQGLLAPEDHQLLTTIGRQSALGIHNSRLAIELSARLPEIRRQAEQLSTSRARIVQTQDAERRRIERNIHDGVQQQMVALIANFRLARNQLGRDPQLADATLAALQHQTRQTLADLRELAQGIHPAVLTDHGLLAAVEAQASRLPIGVAIEADTALRGLRFAEEIEGAAYFLVCEGLANVLKHARTSRATVRLSTATGRLMVEVADDGVGLPSAEIRCT